MILTGAQIHEACRIGDIRIDSFSEEMLNPNSYNYRLGPSLIELVGAEGESHASAPFEIPEDGYVLQPGKLYLGHTAERIGSSRYAMSLIGRSSLGRLGLFLQVSANLGHTGSYHCWTLEMLATQPLRVYPHMKIGQVSFWLNEGSYRGSQRTYAQFDQPEVSHAFGPLLRDRQVS